MTPEEFELLRRLFDEQHDNDLAGGARHGTTRDEPPEAIQRQLRLLIDSDEEVGACFLTPLLDSMMMVQGDVEEETEQPIGQVLDNRYVLERELGSAMSVVYLAGDLKLKERQWVVKVLKAGSVNRHWRRERIKEEMESLARLNHHAIVAVYDGGVTADGRPYFVMPYADGTVLRELIDRGPLDATSTLFIVKQLAAALAHAHRRNVVHLDVKPSNILIRDIGGADPHVWLVDFGIAMIRTPKPGENDRLPAGTRGYMSPEQAEGGTDEDCDVYSLAVVCFEMLTGRLPTDADLAQLEAVRSGRRTEHPSSFAQEANSLIALPEDVQRVIARALTRDLAQRIRSAQHFATEVEHVLSPFVFWQRALTAAASFFQSARDGSRAANRYAARARRRARGHCLQRDGQRHRTAKVSGTAGDGGGGKSRPDGQTA